MNSFVQILNSTGIVSFVSVSGFRSTLILTLSTSCGCSILIGVVSFGATSRQSVTSLSSLALSVVMLPISLTYSAVLIASMTISRSMQTSMSSHFFVYLV